MLLSEFESIWSKVFDKHSDDWNALYILISNELKEKGLLKTAENKLAFEEIWYKHQKNADGRHFDEFLSVSKVLTETGIIFKDMELQKLHKLKVVMERDLIRWLIDLYEDVDMNALINKIKLEPRHFSDLFCQSVYRIILSLHSQKKKWGLTDIYPVIKDSFIDLLKFIDFYTEDRKPCYDGAIMVRDYADKIMELNELIKDELKKQDDEIAELIRQRQNSETTDKHR